MKSEPFSQHAYLNREAAEGVITLHEDDQDAVDAMLQYLYKSDYSEPTPSGKPSSLVLDCRTHTIADKYDVTPLRALATSKFTERAEKE